MLKASENFKLIKTIQVEVEGPVEEMPFFLIEYQGKEYISAGSRFAKNTADGRELFKKYPYLEDGFNQLFDSSPVSGWEELRVGNYCFWSCPFEIGHWDINLPNLVNGDWMFWGCKTLTRFSGNLDSLRNGHHMFNCSGLNSFKSALPSLETGFYMFTDCRNLTSFRGSLPQLMLGGTMFRGCVSLSAFDIPLPQLVDGFCMFKHCNHLSAFSVPLPHLKFGDYMFEDCKNLTSFNVPIPILCIGRYMFKNSGLKYFSTPTPYLKSRHGMLKNTPLKASSKSDLKTT